MGDFDKKQSDAPKSETKKIIMCCVLGAVLLGVGVMQFGKSGPQSASAAGPEGGRGGGDLMPVQQSPEDAQAALRDDPTAKLLRNTKTEDAAFNVMPSNPFLMADDWRRSLVKTSGPVHVHVDNTPQHTVVADVPILSLTDGDFKLTGVFRQGKVLYAIINGEIVTTGATIGKGRVTEIFVDHVAMQHVDSPDGPHLVLTIERKLK